MNILYSASGVLTLFFIVLLLSKKQKSLADYIFIGWFLLILLVIVTTYIRYNHIQVWQGLFDFTDSSAYLHGPMVWFYTLALTKEDFRFRKKDWWHLLPFIISTVYVFYPLLVGKIVSDGGRNTILVTKMLILFAYGIAVLYQLKMHKEKITNYFSYTEKIKLSWLKLVIWCLIVIWVISAVSQLINFFGGFTIPQDSSFFTNLALSVFVLVIGYFGIRQTSIFVSPQYTENKGNSKPFSKSVKNIFDNTDQIPQTESSFPEKRYHRLLEFMEKDKPYLNDRLTIYDLATKLYLPPYYVSQLINRHSGKSFFDFVNYYRVEEVKKKIQAQTHYRQTLLAIALDCGFNSKSSFNRVFKKMTGQTPSEFVKSLE